MPSSFPGMNPYLENPALWPNVHGRLIVAIADALSPLLLPKYQPIIEESVYKTSGQGSVMVGVPDIAPQKTSRKAADKRRSESDSAVALAVSDASPVIVELPVPVTLRQRFIEIRNTANQEVVTVIEVLSLANKRGEGRLRYTQKRERIIESRANLVEIDLLHKGAAMPTVNGSVECPYRILVSAERSRPQALLYPFGLTQPLPTVSIPLREGDREPKIDFQALLNRVYERSGYRFSIDYSQPPKPGWAEAELAWIAEQTS